MVRRAFVTRKRLSRYLRNRLVQGILGAAGALSMCAVVFYLVERGSNPDITSIGSGFNWVISTLLQQFSSKNITTATGNVLYYIVLLIGVGFIAMATATIASRLIQTLMRTERGMGKVKMDGHIVICGWNSKGEEILTEIRADKAHQAQDVVILASVESNPMPHDEVAFVHGHPSHVEDLQRAGIMDAAAAIVLADEGLSPWDADAKTILRTLAVKSTNPECYVCVEVLKSENRQHFQHTDADELIVSGEITGALLASAAVTHGISYVVNDLLTHPEGNEFYAVRPPVSCLGKNVEDALTILKREHNSILIGISDDKGGYAVNPPSRRIIEPMDMLLVIAEDDESLVAAPQLVPLRTARSDDQSSL